jgi:bifunctional non-homologous end joining protein LigD
VLDLNIAPMLAYSSDPFDSRRHVFEIKWDGTRTILFLNGRNIRLQNRRFVDMTNRYPELYDLHRDIRAREAVLDGELVVLSGDKPDFGKLQQREQISDPMKIRLLSGRMPATYIVFDILFLDGRECIGLPLLERKSILDRIVRESGSLVISRHIPETGKSFFREVVAKGFEGVMAKSDASPYLIGKRSRYWLKIKPKLSSVCHIIGYTRGEGYRGRSFGALLIATRDEERWVYRGKVGSGFDEEDLESLLSLLGPLKAEQPAFPVPGRPRDIQWVKPSLKCEVVFQEMTKSGHFRAPVFKRVLP